MQRKPWPIVVLALIHFLEPIAKILFYSVLWKMPVGTFLNYMRMQSTPLALFLFLGMFPLAGVAILAVKRWSLPMYFLIQAITLGGHIYYHETAPNAFPMYLVVGLTVMNLLVVSYFVLPAVRIAYLDPKVRWWEAKPRYLVDWKGKATQGKTTIDVTISNISEGGMFCQTTGKSATLATEDAMHVDFTFDNKACTLPGRIRHYSAGSGTPKYGIQFTELDAAQKAMVKHCIRTLRTMDAPRQGRGEDPIESFKMWATTLFKTGKGLVPEMTQLPAKKSQITVGSSPTSSSVNKKAG